MSAVAISISYAIVGGICWFIGYVVGLHFWNMKELKEQEKKYASIQDKISSFREEYLGYDYEKVFRNLMERLEDELPAKHESFNIETLELPVNEHGIKILDKAKIVEYAVGKIEDTMYGLYHNNEELIKKATGYNSFEDKNLVEVGIDNVIYHCKYLMRCGMTRRKVLDLVRDLIDHYENTDIEGELAWVEDQLVWFRDRRDYLQSIRP